MNAKLDQREAAKSENPNARTGTEKDIWTVVQESMENNHGDDHPQVKKWRQ